MKTLATFAAVLLAALSPTLSQADEKAKDMTKEMQAGREVLEREAARAERAAERNRGHEGRLSVREGVSVGGEHSTDRRTGETRTSVDVRVSHDVGGK